MSFDELWLKTWLRTTMDQKRLTGLALMNVHRDIDIDVDKVIDRFAKSGKRRMPFICNFTGVFLNVLLLFLK